MAVNRPVTCFIGLTGTRFATPCPQPSAGSSPSFTEVPLRGSIDGRNDGGRMNRRERGSMAVENRVPARADVRAAPPDSSAARRDGVRSVPSPSPRDLSSLSRGAGKQRCAAPLPSQRRLPGHTVLPSCGRIRWRRPGRRGRGRSLAPRPAGSRSSVSRTRRRRADRRFRMAGRSWRPSAAGGRGGFRGCLVRGPWGPRRRQRRSGVSPGPRHVQVRGRRCPGRPRAAAGRERGPRVTAAR